MASLNQCNFIRLYRTGLTTREVSALVGVCVSTVSYQLRKAGVMRGPKEAQVLAGLKGRKHHKRENYNHSEETKIKMSKAAFARWNGKSKGTRVNTCGYIEGTTGENKGKLMHRVIMEEHIGRGLLTGECIHHIDRNKTNNSIDNLALMTLSDHMRLHGKDEHKNRTRDGLGRFK